MAEGEGLEPTSPKAPVFKTGALPITLTLRKRADPWIVPEFIGWARVQFLCSWIALSTVRLAMMSRAGLA